MNCRTNHIHVVVTAPERSIELPREQFKAWCTRSLKAQQRKSGSTIIRERWWTERGWDEFLDDDRSVEEVVKHVDEGQ